MIKTKEKCANCSITIGDLETHHIFKGKIVCSKCDGRLRPGNIKPIPVQPLPTVTTQLTSKTLKLQIMISAMLMMVCMVWFVIALTSRNLDTLYIPVTIGFWGFVWFMITKVLIYWNHK